MACCADGTVSACDVEVRHRHDCLRPDPQLSLPRCSAQAGAPLAHLVWCHERCFKPERRELRTGIEKAAVSRGLELVSFKKAKGFLTWLHSLVDSTPYILVSDNRELRPCLSFLKEVPRELQPVMTAVLVDESRLRERIETFLEGRSKRSATSIRQVPDSPVILVESLQELSDVLEKAACHLKPCVEPGTCCSSNDSTELFSSDESEAPSASRVSPCDSTRSRAPTPRERGSSFVECSGVGWATPVLDLLGCAFPDETATEVELMLKAAAPDVYED